MRRSGWAVKAVLLLTPLSPGWAQPAAGPTQNALAGSWVFGAKGCANCHSVNGVGTTVGPDLGRGELRSYHELAAAFWNHFPSMAGRMRAQGLEPPRMSTREMGDLIAFLTAVNYFDHSGDARKGELLFDRKGCVRCHQVGGSGGVIGPRLDHLSQTTSSIEVAAAMWNHGPAMIDAMQARGISRPTFTVAELTDLLAYLRSTASRVVDRPVQLFPGRADLGRQWFIEKGCSGCHGFAGQGGGRAPDLAQRDRRLSFLEFTTRLWNKVPAMLLMMRELGIRVPQLEAHEMADLVAYLSSVQYFQPQGSAAAGRALLGSRGCLRCHSLAGRGARAAGDLGKARGLDSPAAVIAALWNHGRLAPEAAEGRSRWPTLSSTDVRDITAFFLRTGSGR